MREHHLNRVAVIGCGNVAAGSVYSLLMNGIIRDVVLIGEDSDSLLDQVKELRQKTPFEHSVQLWTGDFPDAADAEIAVISATGLAHRGETKFERLERDAAEIRRVVRKLKETGFAGIILVTSNPVGVLTQVAFEESGFPPHKIIGSGAVQEAAALQSIFKEEIGLSSTCGERAPEAPTWCAAQLGAAPFVEFCRPDCPDFPKMIERVRLTSSTRRGEGASLIVASCVNRICEAILRDERTIVPVCALTTGQYGIEGVYLTLPAVIGRDGIERLVEFPLDDAELANLHASASLLKRLRNRLSGEAAIVGAHRIF